MVGSDKSFGLFYALCAVSRSAATFPPVGFDVKSTSCAMWTIFLSWFTGTSHEGNMKPNINQRTNWWRNFPKCRTRQQCVIGLLAMACSKSFPFITVFGQSYRIFAVICCGFVQLEENCTKGRAQVASAPCVSEARNISSQWIRMSDILYTVISTRWWVMISQGKREIEPVAFVVSV